MKIEGNIYGPEATYGGRQSSGRTESGASFADLLAQAVSEDNGSQPTAPAAVSATKPASLDNQAAPAIWGDLNGLLDSLDNYAQALGNPGVSLKQLEPLAMDLERKADVLESNLTAGNGGSLTDLAQEALTQARVEAFKFRRGDYV